MSEPLNESEIETLRKGALGAGLLVSVSDRGFFDTFKEAGTLAKHVAAAHGSSESVVVRQLAEGHGGDQVEAATVAKIEAALASGRLGPTA